MPRELRDEFTFVWPTARNAGQQRMERASSRVEDRQAGSNSTRHPVTGNGEQDSFLFTIPDSLWISISVETVNGFGPDAFVPQAGIRARNASDLDEIVALPFNAAASGLVKGVLDTGVFNMTFVGRTADEPGPYAFDGRVTISAVPEPSTALLLGLVLAGLCRRQAPAPKRP